LLLLFSFAGFVALAAQTTFPRILPNGMLVPNLMAILAVDLGLRHPSVLAAAIAFAMGYAIDAFSGVQLGLNALMMTLVFLLAYWLSRVLISTSTIIAVLAVFAGVIFSDLATSFASNAFAPPGRLRALMPAILMQAGVTAFLTPWVFRIMGWATRLLGLRLRAVSG